MVEEEECILGGGLDDWYDAAIKAGQGFKTEQEREAYIKSLGDPLKHPLFAQSGEDLVGNPLADAIRALREEDKTFVELATMYKDEGNEVLRKGDTKSLREASDKYTYALTFVDEADNARKNHSEDEKDKFADLTLIRSQILSNRAHVALTLKNYASCISDANNALQASTGNMKAHFRKAKALLQLKHFELCLDACSAALVFGDSADIMKIRAQCQQEMDKRSQRELEKDSVKRDREDRWGTIWDNVLSSSSSKIALGYPTSDYPEQIKDALPHIDTTDGTLRWPVLFLYPQYHQIDMIPDAGIDDMLAEHLADMFPEFEDPATVPAPWDSYREYQVSSLVVYVSLRAGPVIASKAEWVKSCEQLRALRGLDGSAPQLEAQELFSSRQQQHLDMLVTAAVARKQNPGKGVASGRGSSSVSRSVTGGGSSSLAVKIPSDAEISQYLEFVEIHLGCTFRQVLHMRDHVACGGVLTLIVFSRGNDAHKAFLKSANEGVYGKVLYLNANGHLEE